MEYIHTSFTDAHGLTESKSSSREKVERYLSENGLELLKPAGKDNLAGLFTSKSTVKSVVMLLLMYGFTFLPCLASMLEGNFNNPHLSVDFKHDIGYYNQFILGFLAVVVILKAYFSNLPYLIFQLVSSGSILMTNNDYKEFIKTSNRYYNNPYAKYIPYVVGVLVSLYGRVIYFNADLITWNATSIMPYGTVAGWLTTIPVFFLYYLIGLIIIRVVFTFIVLKKLFTYDVEIQPLHPDNCGGLSALGKLSSLLSLGVFIFGIIISVGLYANINIMGFPWYDPAHFVVIGGYILGASILFFFPLRAAHAKMKEAKVYTLKILNDRFTQINKELVNEIKNGNSISNDDIESYESIKKLYDVASDMPVYPFDLKTISTFFGTTLFPVLLIVLEIMISSFF